MVVLEIPLFINEPCCVSLPLNHEILSVQTVNNTPMLNVLDKEELGMENQHSVFCCFTQNQVMPYGKKFQYIGSCVIFNKQYHVFKFLGDA